MAYLKVLILSLALYVPVVMFIAWDWHLLRLLSLAHPVARLIVAITFLLTYCFVSAAYFEAGDRERFPSTGPR